MTRRLPLSLAEDVSFDGRVRKGLSLQDAAEGDVAGLRGLQGSSLLFASRGATGACRVGASVSCDVVFPSPRTT